jgi:hypothetical protein
MIAMEFTIELDSGLSSGGSCGTAAWRGQRTDGEMHAKCP